jgi:hypothetical protein
MQTPSKDRLEQILTSLDKAQRVPAPAYFYTRLRARLDEPQPIEQRSMWLRPIPVLGILLAFVVLNFWLINMPDNASLPAEVVVIGSAEEELQALAFEDRTTDYPMAEYELIVDLNQK